MINNNNRLTEIYMAKRANFTTGNTFHKLNGQFMAAATVVLKEFWHTILGIKAIDRLKNLIGIDLNKIMAEGFYSNVIE